MLVWPFNKLVYIGLETTGLDTSRQPPAQPSIVAHKSSNADGNDLLMIVVMAHNGKNWQYVILNNIWETQ